jgi:orotate phosphoribosyltransferase
VNLDSLLAETGALLSGHFRLSSGLHSPNYVQCARLLEHPRNATRLGEALAARIAALGAERIVAPALGGVVIGYTVAAALEIPMIFTERKEGEMTLRRGFEIGQARRVIIVEDVVTTGKSTRETAAAIERLGAEVIGFASILNRSGLENPFEQPFHYLAAMKLESWSESDCPMCRDAVPLDSPGSRFAR